MSSNTRILIRNYYENHRDELLLFVSRRLGGLACAEDVVQDVFVRLLTSNQLISEVSLPALVHTIARRLVIDLYRRRFFRREYENYYAAITSIESSGEAVVYERELIDRVERCICRLPENCRVICRMHMFEGMKVSEISQHLGQGYKSVEKHLGIARKEVRRRLATG